MFYFDNPSQHILVPKNLGFWAPVYADWGYQNRTCGLRVSAPGRFEYRSVDSMHNPYLLGAALLKALSNAAPNKYGLCIESTDLYSNLPGADTLRPHVLF